MSHEVVLVVFIVFLVFVFALVVRAFLLKFARPAISPPEEYSHVQSVKPHEHRWRYITEFAKQCQERTCGKVETMGPVPDGMADYLDLMTTRKARIDPKGEASHYPEMDPRAWGVKCPACERVIGDPDGLARNPFTGNPVHCAGLVCPYCQKYLVFNLETKQWRKR